MHVHKPTHPEPHGGPIVSKLNWLRAAVLGANDGIVSVASLVVGVAGAIADIHAIIVSGVAGLLAGALSMAAGEYVSVSSQRDTEKALLAKEQYELKHYPEEEFEELAGIYEKKGLTPQTAHTVAREFTEHDVLAAHLEAELHIDPKNLTNPWHAAYASAAAFTVGALVPLGAIFFSPESLRIGATFAAVFVALVCTGVLSARAGNAPALRATTRVVLGGLIAMAVTYGIGTLFGVAV